MTTQSADRVPDGQDVPAPATSAGNLMDFGEEEWRRTVFPEWGTWLNEDIDRATIEPGHLGLWWISNMGVWLRTAGGTNLAVDLWCGTGKQTHDLPRTADRHQWHRALGARLPQPNLRAQPMTFNPYAITTLDAVLATHFHHDHIDRAVAAAVMQRIERPIPFIGPRAAVEQWLAWGVPRERVRIVEPGDTVEVGDVTIDVLESFDRTVLITDPVGMEIPEDDVIPPMGERAVNYLFTTDAGTVYHGGDSHYSTRFAEHGMSHDIDIALLAYGENPIGVQDKMTSVDILRAAEALDASVVIPLHWDAWTNTLADPHEIELLWRLRRDRFEYRFHPFHWLPGSRLDWPDDSDRLAGHHDRGFADRFLEPPNLPYPEMF